MLVHQASGGNQRFAASRRRWVTAGEAGVASALSRLGLVTHPPLREQPKGRYQCIGLRSGIGGSGSRGAGESLVGVAVGAGVGVGVGVRIGVAGGSGRYGSGVVFRGIGGMTPPTLTTPGCPGTHRIATAVRMTTRPATHVSRRRISRE